MNQKIKLQSTLQNRLTEYMFTVKKYDNNFNIAKIMLSKLHNFPDITIEEIAFLANTTPSSITKFCKKLGYEGFTDLREPDPKIHLLTTTTNKMSQFKTHKDYLDCFISEYLNIFTGLFDYFNQEQAINIAKKIKESNKSTILSGLHGFNAVNFFGELSIAQKYTIYEIYRDSEDLVIQDCFKSSDLVIIISLTGNWIEKNIDIIDKNKTILLTYNYSNDDFENIVNFSNIPNFFDSTLISSSALTAYFIYIDSFLKTFV